MKLKAYICALHAALFAILLAVSPAGATSVTLTGAGKTSSALPGPPVLSFVDIVASTGGNDIQTSAPFTPGSDGPHLLMVATTMASDGLSFTSMTIAPTTGTGTCALGPNAISALYPTISIWYCTMTAASPGITTVTITYGQSPFTGSRFAVWSTPLSGLVSTSPISGGGASTALVANVASTSIGATINGFCISAAVSLNFAGGVTASYGTTFTYTNQYSLAGGNGTHTGAYAPASSTTTATANVTYTGTAANLGIAAACWR